MRRESLLALVLAFAACRTAPSPPLMRPVDLVRVAPAELPALGDDLAPASLAEALAHDLEALGRRANDETIRVGDASCGMGDFRAALDALRVVAVEGDGAAVEKTLREHWIAFRSTGRGEGPLITGYYEPVVDGRRARSEAFPYPLYGRPPDLIDAALGTFSPQWLGFSIAGRVEGEHLVGYYTRRDIDERHVLDGHGLELVWLSDPVARYFLQVQGSGIVRLEDGATMRVGFAASNGRPYTSIGRILAAEGALGGEPASAPAIQRWLRAHPERQGEILFQNERYVFFREVEDGPIGGLGVRLTAGRSIAVDPLHYPLGVLAYLESETPIVDREGRATGRRPLRRLAVVQDTGAAIAGPSRVDLFFGSGEDAGLEAGTMSASGALYFLIPAC